MTRDEAIRYILDKASARNLTVEILASEERELNIDTHDGRISEFKQASNGGVGLRLVEGGKVGYAWTEELEPHALEWVLDEALENALLQDEDSGFLPTGSDLGRTDLLSEGLSAPIAEKAALARNVEETLKQDPRYDKTQTVRYVEREQQKEIASTLGARGGYRVGMAGVMSSFVMREAESIKQAIGLNVSKEFHNLDPTVTAQEVLEKTGRLLGARPLATGRYRAYLEPHVVGQLLRVLIFSFSGKNLVEGRSRLADKLGETIASSQLTLLDEPNHAQGTNQPFDSEGTPTRQTVLIEGGVMRSFLHNSWTARQSGQENTGHASRSYKGTLGVAPTNLVIAPGSGVTVDDGVVVTDLMGVHAGANPISGDVSLQAFGLRAEGGESYPVENFVISGNLFRILESITGLGAESEWDAMTNAQSPLVEIESLSFGGA